MQRENDSQKISAEYLSVNSCGTEIALERDIPTFRPEGRIDYHILYVENGVCCLEKDGYRQEVPKGNVILFRPGEKQKYCFLAQYQSVSQYIHFTGKGCAELLARFLPVHQQVFYIGPSTTFKMVLERMAQEIIFKRPFYEETCAAYLFQILALMGRKLLQYATKDNPSWPEKRIEKICYQMHLEYHKNISLEQYAADSCLSLSRFSHLFKQSMGVSPGAYRNLLRIEKAKELLLFTDLPVGDIGELVGFKDENYFTRLFTAAVGYTPTKYRKRS